MSIHWAAAPNPPRPPRETKAPDPWNLPPWDHSSFFATERCVMYTLIHTLGFALGVDFLFQKRIPVKGINQTGVNRSDFWILPSGKGATYGVGGFPFWFGRILNPIASTILIHNPNKDRFERDLFRAQHFDIIYLLDRMLYQQPRELVEEALRGNDKSGR